MLIYNIALFFTFIVHPFLNIINKNTEIEIFQDFNNIFISNSCKYLTFCLFYQYFVNCLYKHFSVYKPWVPVSKNINIGMVLILSSYWLFN